VALAAVLAPAAARADTVTFQARRSIEIPEVGAASPYPSPLRVLGVTGTPSGVTVRLNGLGPALSPPDLDVLLVGPGAGDALDVMVMSDVCSHTIVWGADYAFDDAAASGLPADDLDPDACDPTNLGGPAYRPSNAPPAEVMPAPAPGPPYGSALTPLASPSPLGTWRLFVQDDFPDSSHYRMARGWALRLRGVRSRLRCGGRRATIVGSSRPETLVGTPGRDVIVGLGGRDVIRSFGGGDYVCGGRGPDLLLGARGNDRMLGGPGNDRLFGGPGSDLLLGGPGRDALRGLAGRPHRCFGGAGRDRRRSPGCEIRRSIP
jgi:hypothetical protein